MVQHSSEINAKTHYKVETSRPSSIQHPLTKPMATTTCADISDGPITVITHMKIQPGRIPRFAELCRELIADVEDTEPAGDVQYHVFRNNDVGDELTLVESYVFLSLFCGRMLYRLIIFG